MCKGKQRCPKCGGEHRFEECRENMQDKCCNCGGPHRVTYGGCEVRKRAVEIQQVKTVSNISYSEAVKKVQGQRGRVDIIGRENHPVLRLEESQAVKTHTELTADKLIVFIAYVINCTDQVKHKTEKIKIIVKGAEKFLGLKEVSWERINKKLEADGRQEGSGDRSN